MLRLFSAAGSGNCHRVRLLLGLLAIPHEVVDVHGGRGNLRAPGLVEASALGEVPAIADGETVLRDSQAILVYLAGRHSPSWLGDGPADLARIIQWLSLSANEIQNGLRMVRVIRVAGRPGDLDSALRLSELSLRLLEQRLRDRDWLECGRPTIADVTCHPYVWNAAEAGIDMSTYPAVLAWVARLRVLPGYVTL
jgi:glutathione S-transferase